MPFGTAWSECIQYVQDTLLMSALSYHSLKKEHEQVIKIFQK